MNLSNRMLEAAARAREFLGGAVPAVRAFVESRFTAAGGVAGRGGEPDLYYTVFGVDALLALGGRPPDPARLAGWLRVLGPGAALDLPHLACLARCRARLPDATWSPTDRRAALARVGEHRCPDGGYALRPGAESVSPQAAFLACSAHADLGGAPPAAGRLLAGLCGSRTADGGYAERAGAAEGSTQTTAAAALTRRALTGARPDDRAVRWLRARQDASGGFRAGPSASTPDLVSTAVAAFTLWEAGAGLRGAAAERCADYVGGLWDDSGGFLGHWADTEADCEHTFDALLTLGCLDRVEP